MTVDESGAEERVMVTGAGGFIGRHLVRRLAAGGSSVLALDVQPESPFAGLKNVDYRTVDVRDDRALLTLLRGVDIVFHLASMHLQVHADEAAFQRVNVQASGVLVNRAAEAGVRRLVHTSSVGVYGHVEAPPATEDAPKRPQTPYERTKLAGESLVIDRARASGLDVVVLRPAWVYGAGCRRTAKLLRSIEKGRFFYIGRGDNLRHPLYISDMIDAYLLAAGSEAADTPRIYNIAGPRPLRLREMIDSAAGVLGVSSPRLAIPRPAGWVAGLAAELAFRPIRREPPFSRRSLAFFFNDNAFSIAAAAQDLGFRPTVEFESGLRLTMSDGAAA